MRFKATSSGMKIPVEVTRRITNETTWAGLRAPTRAFTATENANVCTSVRNKYFTVELTTPEYEPSARLGAAEWATEAGEAGVLDCWSRSSFSNPIRELRCTRQGV